MAEKKQRKPRTKKANVMNGDPAVLTPTEHLTEKRKAEQQHPLVFADDVKVVAIINFNTPELTEAAIKSVRKHGGENYQIVVFDNSCTIDFEAVPGIPARHYDARPFTAKMDGVTVIDNTQGQVIDFKKLLADFPDRTKVHGLANDWGSDKHIWTVQKLWELIPNGFVLLESDVLLTKNIDFMFNRAEGVIGYVQQPQPHNRFNIGRLVPMLCWMNVPMLTKCGARYFDPERAWMLYPDIDDRRNWYDTGAVLLEDVRSHMNGLCGKHIDIRNFMIHKQSGSWRRMGLTAEQWLKMNETLWK